MHKGAARDGMTGIMNTEILPEHIRAVEPYLPGKPIEETKREFKLQRVIKLASNENPLGPSPKAKAALRKELKELHRYPDSNGFHLKAALSRHLNWPAEGILLGNGSNDVIDCVVRTFTKSGDIALCTQAAFVAFKIAAKLQNLKILELPLKNDLSVDLRKIAQALRENSEIKIVYLANPNNPTGTAFMREEWQEFLRAIASMGRKDFVILYDAAYEEYAVSSDLPKPLDDLREVPQLIISRTFSKIYGLAGLRVGYGIGNPAYIAATQKVRQPFNVNSLAMVAAQAALKDRAFVEKSKKLNRQGLLTWTKKLKQLGIPYFSSFANFILIDVQSGLGLSGQETFLKLIRTGIITRPVNNYGLPGALRISVGSDVENRLALKELEKIHGNAP